MREKQGENFFERIIGMGLLSDVFGSTKPDFKRTSRIILADEKGQRSGEDIIADLDRSLQEEKLAMLESVLKRISGKAQELERRNRELQRGFELEKKVSHDRRHLLIELTSDLGKKTRIIAKLEEKKARATLKLTRAHEEIAGQEMVFDRVVGALLEMVEAKGKVSKKKIKSIIDILIPPSAEE